MKVLFDSSVLVAAIVQKHQHHSISQPWLDAALQGQLGYFVSTHSLAEVYSTLSGKIGPPILPTLVVWQLMESMILNVATIIELDCQDYQSCLKRLVANHERGGIVYDALIVQAALKSNVDKLLTLNAKHFTRLWPNHTNEVISPLSMQVP